MDKTYVQPIRLNKLHDELIAAGITPSLVQGTNEPGPICSSAHIVAPQASAAVDAVLAAHNSATPSTAEQQAIADQADLATFPTRAQVTSALTTIQNDITTLQGTPTNAAVLAIMIRKLQREQFEIKALAAVVRRQT